jgi:hypothetical protein
MSRRFTCGAETQRVFQFSLRLGVACRAIVSEGGLQLCVEVLAPKSGAKDTRSPNASRLPGVLEPREASGVRACSPPLSLAWRWLVTFSLIPAFSSRRRRIVFRLTEKPATGFAGRSFAKRKTDTGCSFSPGEKVRMRASVPTILILISFEPAARRRKAAFQFSLRLGAPDYKPNQSRTAASSFTKSVSCNWPRGLRTNAPDTEVTARLANDG